MGSDLNAEGHGLAQLAPAEALEAGQHLLVALGTRPRGSLNAVRLQEQSKSASVSIVRTALCIVGCKGLGNERKVPCPLSLAGPPEQTLGSPPWPGRHDGGWSLASSP